MDISTEKLLGMEIKTVRESKGLHQKDVIAKYKAMYNEDLSQARLSSYETGKRTASIDTLLKIARTLDWEIDKTNTSNNENWANLLNSIKTLSVPEDQLKQVFFIVNKTSDEEKPTYYHPLINYLYSEDIGVDICKDEESKIEIQLKPIKGDAVSFSKKEFEALNRSVKEFIEFQLYKKSHK